MHSLSSKVLLAPDKREKLHCTEDISVRDAKVNGQVAVMLLMQPKLHSLQFGAVSAAVVES